MKRHCAPLPFVAHLDLKTEDVAKLALERLPIRIGDGCRIARARSADIGARSGAALLPARAQLRLPDGESLGDDFSREPLRIIGRGHSARVTHADIALQ